MSDLRELYQAVILDHHKRPHNYRVIEPADAHAEGHNPLCGDKVTIYLKLDGDRVTDVSFQGQGCAISQASASMMTDALKGKSREEIDRLFRLFHDLITAPEPPSDEGLGKLAVFSGVREFPLRAKCATLPWHTFKSAIDRSADKVTTE